MDNILLYSGCLPAMTLIQNSFIENYMLSANGSYVKVYLYLSKCIQAGEQKLSISSLADKMDNTEKDIIRALNYWEKNHLIRLSKENPDGRITVIEMLNPDSPGSPAKKTWKPETPGSAVPDNPVTIKSTAVQADSSGGDGLPEKTDATTPLSQTGNTEKLPPETGEQAKHIDINITPEQSERLSCDEEFVWTSRVIESYVNRPLGPAEVQLISYLYDNLGFSPDLLLYLYEYCISLGKTNINYIQAVALAWDEKGIKTPEDAKNAATNYNATYTAVSKAFALGRKLAMVEKQYVAKWLDKWHMDLAVVLDACNRTMLKLQKADFRYTDGTLESWNKNNIHTLQDVQKADEAYAKAKTYTKSQKKQTETHPGKADKNQFNRFQQRDVSQEEIDDLEKKLLAH